MKLKVTKNKVFEGGKMVPIGTVIEVEGDVIPGALVNKVTVLEEAPVEETPVPKTEPTKTPGK